MTDCTFKLKITYLDKYDVVRSITTYWSEFGKMVDYASNTKRKLEQDSALAVKATYRIISSTRILFEDNL